ncbi:MAG: hypothetical protein ACXADB_13660 [Candidatus Hermodarchaeia archaeon]|jgi:hypothetical protein
MPIFKGSRYRFSSIIQVDDSDGNTNGVYVLRSTTEDVPDGSIPHQVSAKDTFESLAFKKYSDANKWYVVADVNPQVFFPLDLTPGEVIYLPPNSYTVAI